MDNKLTEPVMFAITANSALFFSSLQPEEKTWQSCLMKNPSLAKSLGGSSLPWQKEGEIHEKRMGKTRGNAALGKTFMLDFKFPAFPWGVIQWAWCSWPKGTDKLFTYYGALV